MAEVPVTITGVIADLTGKTITGPVKFLGSMVRTDLGVGGGPIFPPEGGGGGGDNKPPGIWGGGNEPFPTPPIHIPKPPDVFPGPPPDGLAKDPPPGGGWGYSLEFGWGFFPMGGPVPGPK